MVSLEPTFWSIQAGRHLKVKDTVVITIKISIFHAKGEIFVQE
jgi:hypothetical protein